MAKKNDSKRAERIAKNNQRLDQALSLFTVGFIAECYLLTINKLFVRGTVNQLVAVSYFLDVMVYVGLALVAAGVVLHTLRAKKPCFRPASFWLMSLGVFFTLSSELMRRIYPAGTTIMCILVPVLMLLSVVYLLYPFEFSVEATALTLTIAAAALINHGTAGGVLNLLVKLIAVAVLLMLAAAIAAVITLRKKEFAPLAKADCKVLCAVLALGIVCTAAALLIPGAAYYVLWVSAVALFLMAVLHTVKML